MLIIVGRPKDVKRYKKQRQVTWDNIDPSTGQSVEYGGLKKIGLSKDSAALENNPWVKHGPEYRIMTATMKAVIPQGKSFTIDDTLDIAGIANANIVDRVAERVNPAGLDASNFMKNRVLLIDHMYQSRQTVGRVTELRAEADGVHFEATVGDPSKVGGHQNLTQIQKDTRSLIAQGYLQTVSIGFIPKKIRAPVYTDEGVMDEPAVIEQWEMLELSIVAVPANPGAIFEAKALAKTFYNIHSNNSHSLTTTKETNKNKSSISTKVSKVPEDQTVQTLIFQKEKFTLASATDWANDYGYNADRIDETEESFRMIQRDTKDFDAEETFKTMELASGVGAVIGKLRKDLEEMDKEQAKELIDGIKALNVSVTSGLKNLGEQNEKILGSLSGAEGKKKEEEEEEEDDETKKTVKENSAAIKEISATLKQMDVIIGELAKHIK